MDETLAADMGSENGEFFREPAQRLQKRIQIAAGEKLIQAAEPMQDALLDLAIHPLVVDDEEISAGTVGLRAYEQGGAPVSPSYAHITYTIQGNIEINGDSCATRISPTAICTHQESITCEQTIGLGVEDEFDDLQLCPMCYLVTWND